MTLREMRATYPDAFYPNQHWFDGEDFMDVTARVLPWPRTIRLTGTIEPQATAADLAALYLEHPDCPLWSRYLWTCDHDRHGQRVYVGDNGFGLEIHRHLALSDRWCVPCWQ